VSGHAWRWTPQILKERRVQKAQPWPSPGHQQLWAAITRALQRDA